MSDKKRRDITLGEMQDECKKYWNNGNLGSCGKCQYMEVCCHYESYAPAQLNLTDPPRFNEDQMAFWRGWHAMGADLVTRFGDGHMVFSTICGDDLGTIERYFDLVDIMEKGETLDLAELLGKDAT